MSVVDIRVSATSESCGTAVVNCVNRSICNDDENGHQGDIKEEESSDSCVSKYEMVCYTEEMKSDGSLSEVEEEMDYLMEEGIQGAIEEDTG
jgi:hypothetical protein